MVGPLIAPYGKDASAPAPVHAPGPRCSAVRGWDEGPPGREVRVRGAAAGNREVATVVQPGPGKVRRVRRAVRHHCFGGADAVPDLVLGRYQPDADSAWDGPRRDATG